MEYTITDYAITLLIISWVLAYGLEVTYHPGARLEQKCKRFIKNLKRGL